MAGLEEENSNTLFDTLADWNTYLKAENIEPNKLTKRSRKSVRQRASAMSNAPCASNTVSPKDQFHKSAKPPQKGKKRGRQPTPRITLRLTEDEMTKLKHLSAGMTVSAYIRKCLFGKKTKPRKIRLKAPIEDQEALAKVLGKLGESRIANNLNQMAYEAHCGSLLLDEHTYNQIKESEEAGWM